MVTASLGDSNALPVNFTSFMWVWVWFIWIVAYGFCFAFAASGNLIQFLE